MFVATRQWVILECGDLTPLSFLLFLLQTELPKKKGKKAASNRRTPKDSCTHFQLLAFLHHLWLSLTQTDQRGVLANAT